MCKLVSISLIVLVNHMVLCLTTSNDFMVIVQRTENDKDIWQRFQRSLNQFNINFRVIDESQDLSALKKVLRDVKEGNPLVFYTSKPNALITGDAKSFIQKFENLNTKLVLGCRRKQDECEDDYGTFFGHAEDMLEALKDETSLESLSSHEAKKVDTTSEIIHNLRANEGKLKFLNGKPFFESPKYEKVPLFLSATDEEGSQGFLNHLGNYIPNAWTNNSQCIQCNEDLLKHHEKSVSVLIGVFIKEPTPFIEEFFTRLASQNYPKHNIHLLIYFNQKYLMKKILSFVEDHSGENCLDRYKSVEMMGPSDKIEVAEARGKGLQLCDRLECDYYLSLDGNVQLLDQDTLSQLIEQNRGIVAPMLLDIAEETANFQGAIDEQGEYVESSNYNEILEGQSIGVWNVPCVTSCYLIQGDVIRDTFRRPSFQHETTNSDDSFCKNNRMKNVFMYFTNKNIFGHLVNVKDFKLRKDVLSNELYELSNNRIDWEQRYLHPNYSLSLEENAEIAQPCPDVYWFPIVSERFADELVAEMENFGEWSNGNHEDTRLSDGYEAVPTRDIHMKQIGLEEMWLDFLDSYVRPLQEKVFQGYESETEALLNFVVRYRPDEQPALRPHHDISTYTINIALNQVGEDYTGGGCRFIRYNCSVPSTKKGWMLLHPGRLTHYHEGLETLSGTRYIMVSFIDP